MEGAHMLYTDTDICIYTSTSMQTYKYMEGERNLVFMTGS